MKRTLLPILILLVLIGCKQKKETLIENPLVGTWQLLQGTTIEKGDTTITDYTQHLKGIKIINATHFSFFNHDLNHGQDSLKSFAAGGGTYSLKGNQYKEHLEFCNYREWENHDFEFTVTIKEDTLIQQGIEKVESIGVERINIEKYVKIK